MQFKVTYEASGFTNDNGLIGLKFTALAAKSFSEVSIANGTLPKDVCAVLGGYVTDDDNQGNKDIHVFVCVDLLIEAESEAKAERMIPPEDLLTKISDLMSDKMHLDLDQHSWEVTAVDEADATFFTVASLILQPAIPAPLAKSTRMRR